MTTMLEAKNLSVSYGKLTAVKDVSFAVEEGTDRDHHRAEWRGQDHAAEGTDRAIAVRRDDHL